jgi:LysR family transcriptional regulator for metE and metH
MAVMVPRLELRHLSVLGALAETGSVTATARRLGVTQSAVSHRVREAERRLGVTLARRAEGGLALTQEGERLRACAERFLDELGRLEGELERSRGRGRQPVRLGQATYSRYHWLPTFLEHLAAREPQMDVDLSGRATARPFAALIDGSVDVSTVYGRPSALPRFRWYWLASDPLVAVMAPDHPLAADAYVDSRTIGDTRVYTYPLSAEPGFEWEALVGPPAEPFRRLTQMPTPESAIDLMRAGFGIGIFSQWAVEPELADGTLIAKPIGEAGLSLDWWAVVRGRDPGDGPAVRLAEALVAWGRRHEQGLASLGFGGER